MAVPSDLRLTRGEKLAVVTTALALLHHLDHVLRVDHSGWPFREEVTPFTFSLLVYVAIAGVLFGRGWRRTRMTLAGVLALFPTLAHIFLETPLDQYRTWATRPDVNAAGVASPLLGAAAVLLTVLLSVFAVWTFIAFVRTRGV
jgi:hypothetical protein